MQQPFIAGFIRISRVSEIIGLKSLRSCTCFSIRMRPLKIRSTVLCRSWPILLAAPQTCSTSHRTGPTGESSPLLHLIWSPLRQLPGIRHHRRVGLLRVRLLPVKVMMICKNYSFKPFFKNMFYRCIQHIKAHMGQYLDTVINTLGLACNHGCHGSRCTTLYRLKW